MINPLMRLLYLPLLPALLMPGSAPGAMFPQTIGHWQLTATSAASVPDAKVWQEYGLQDSETATYSEAGQTWTISGYRFDDATGAFAAFDADRPEDASPVKMDDIGVPNAAGDASQEVVAAGNYLFVIKGYKPTPVELNHVFGTVPRYAQSPLPTLAKYMPDGAIPNSERYIVGPDSLARFAPQISPATAAFHFNAEGEIARYGHPDAETALIIFSYPTPEMARDRYSHFQQVPGAVVKRTGPMIAAVLNPSSADAAERLLAKVKYEASVTGTEHVPTARDNPGNLLLNIMILCLVLAGFCIVSGLLVGGIRVLIRRAGPDRDGDAMISLHLSGRD